VVEGESMNDNKPPMTLYLQNEQSLNEEQWKDDDVTWCRDKIFRHDVGPYVHMEQFLAEVERRSLNDAHKQAEASEVNIPYPDEDVITLWFRETARKLAKEIMEGEL
jgi:hypothetical protein